MLIFNNSIVGTTWMQAILHLLNTPEDVETEQLSVAPFDVAPFLENCFPKPRPIDVLKDMPSPRMIKTHIPYFLLQRALAGVKVKVIVIIRNPKDVAVSLYHFYKIDNVFGFCSRSWKDFFKIFIRGKVMYGLWFDHLLGYLEHKDQPNFHFLTYEDMKTDSVRIIKQLSQFIEKPVSEEYVEKIANLTLFSSMREKMVRHGKKYTTIKDGFMRKGEMGDWKNYFTVAQNEEWEELYKEKMGASLAQYLG